MPRSHTGELGEKKTISFSKQADRIFHMLIKKNQGHQIREKMRNKKYVTHRFKELVNPLPHPPKKLKNSDYMDIHPSKCLPLKY